MNEVLYEETAFPYDYSKQKFLYIFCKVIIAINILMVLFFALILSLSPLADGSWVLPLLMIVLAGLSIAFFVFLKSKFYNCYDYIFVAGDIRIIKVVNTKKRKKIVVMDSKNVKSVGRYESENYNRLRSSPNVKIIYAPSNKTVQEKPKFYIYGTAEGQNYLLVLECTEKFLVHVLQFAGRQALEKGFK